MDFHKYSFSKLAFMVNVTSKSENETFLITRICDFTETWVVTQRGIKGHITSTEQFDDCKLFFRLDGTCNSIVELSNSTGGDFESRIKFNASTGKGYCKWFVCGVCGNEVAPKIKEAKPGWLHSFLSFPPETRKLHFS